MTELHFKGKEFVYNHHLSVPFRPLVPDESKGIGPVDLDGNLIIQGDNLHALKALLPKYAGKVDCIFIDPPYNTGNEGWCYNDNVNAPMIREWFDSNPIGIEDGLRHDKWCAMMWPRLRLLHELLAEDGSLWMTLDDNEGHRAKLLLDEVFTESGFVANIEWQHSVQGKGYSDTFSVHHNHLLVYGKADFSFDGLDRTDEDNVNYTNPDNDPKGDWRSGDVRNSLYRPNLKYDVRTPSGNVISPPENGWRWKKSTLEDKIKSGEVSFVENETKLLRKIYLSDQDKRAPETMWFAREVGSTRDATSMLKQMFGGASPFPTPKPVPLLTKILSIATSESGVVLDSFAGSGTTAHAVLEANKRDGGNRKFILVEMEDYADKLTAERVRRVINGYEFTGTQKTELLRKKLSWTAIDKADKLCEEVESIERLEGASYDKVKKEVKNDHLLVIGETNIKDCAEGLGGSFTYCTLGEPIELNSLLAGENLPAYDALASILFHMATNHTLDAKGMDEAAFYLGETDQQHVWMIYKPDGEWLKSTDAALTLSRAQQFAQAKGADGKRHLVFAPARFVSHKLLQEHGLPVEFAPLPFALYRIERS